MHRRQFLKAGTATTLGMLTTLPVWADPQEAKRPNILMFMADDLGYADLSCFGSKDIQTPVLDQLAKEGVRFTDFYAAAPNCSPSRAAILTGRFPARVGMYSYIPPEGPMHLRTNEITFAKLLQQNSYDTAHIGKWHLCNDLKSGKLPTPSDHGFDWWMATENNALPTHHNPVNFVRNGKETGEIKGYSCQIVADAASHWMTDVRVSDNPFFLNIWFHEPHRKVAAPRQLLAKHPNREDAAYLACIENMDAAIGRVLTHLHQLGLSENTFVLFTSDNGSYHKGSNGDLRAAKSWIWEGGIREPMIMRWPGHIQPGTLCHTPGSGVDILPTLCDIAGIDPPEDRILDGVNLTPLFYAGEIERKTPLIWYFYRTDPACAMREGDWSLIGYLNEKVPPGHSFRKTHMRYIKRAKPDRFELYNLKQDPSQAHDVSGLYPDRFESMKTRIIALHAEIIQEGGEWQF